MRSKFHVGGHPIHTILVAVPIGLFIWAFVADIVYVATDSAPEWYDIAFWSGIAAVVTALLAALFGFADYLTMGVKTDARSVGLAHMLFNLGVVALFAAAAFLMMDDGAIEGGRQTAVMVLHGAGVVLLSVSGYLGGELVYRHHLGVIPETPEIAREEQARHAAPRTGTLPR